MMDRMKKTPLVLFLFVFVLSCSLHAITFPEKTMKAYKQHNIFTLKKYLSSESYSDDQKLFLSAMINNAFCKNDISSAEIDKYVNTFAAEYSDTLFVELLETQLDNYVKLNEYGKAAGVVEKILANSTAALKEKDIKDLKNSLNIWKALAGVKKQEVICDNAGLGFTRDIANLINIEVECGAVKQNAVFDTGANLSVIVESLAGKMNIKPLGDSIIVKAATGTEVNAKIGVAEELKINNIIVKNALFLIFPDEALSFGTFYKINMIIGFPIIRDMGQVIFDLKDNMIYVTKRELTEEGNMFLFGLMPIIKVNFENEELLFSFDSGAKATHFNKIFLETAANYPQYKIIEDSVKIGSAGGIHDKKVKKIEQVKVKILEKEVTLKDVNILKEDLIDLAETTHGNLGQDAISSGKGFIMDFRKMIFKILD